MNTVHMNPFKDQLNAYLARGWRGPLPLPYKQKEAPPTGFNKTNSAYPEMEDFQKWCDDGKQHNICIRLAGVDKGHELVGIDVDHYRKGEKDKKGGDQLAELESKFGSLPDTWIATSRTDGISGIRFFRVPRGYSFRGQVDKDIECIRKGHRYAIVWPSVHPDTGGTYWWYPPGVLPLEENRQAWNEAQLPNAKELPLLPDLWIDHLTRNRTPATDLPIDMDSSLTKIGQWAEDTFYGDSEDEPCALVREKMEKHKKKISEEATHHDKITNFHWNMLCLAFEGHVGWNQALKELEDHWVTVVTDVHNKRGEELRGEIFRSMANALRKIKARSDERVAIGAKPIDSCCVSMGGVCSTTVAEADPGDPIGTIPGPNGLKPVPEYERSDDGNAKHLIDLFSSSEFGPSFKWAEGYGWIVWHEGEFPHWELDQLGNNEIRRMWHKVKDRQLAYADACQAVYDTEVDKAVKAGQPLSGGNAPIALTMARADLKASKEWALRSGNNRQAENAIVAAKSMYGSMQIDLNLLNQNTNLLAVANGVLELNGEDVNLRKAVSSDYITLNTGVPWERPSNFAQNMWDNYLETFLPDEELREVVKILMGHCILGGNKHKVFFALKGDPNTGKSTMINAIGAAMGDYAQTVDQGMLKNRQFNSTLFSAMDKRFAVCSEFDEHDELSSSMIKRITGGTDEVTSEIKYSMASKTGVPQFTLILASNGVPAIQGSDKALKNRLRTIPFDVVPTKIDTNLGDAITKVCKIAVLNWLIEGYQEYCKLGYLPTHPLIEQATEDFMAEMDEVSTFAHDMFQEHSNREKPGIRWQDQSDWCVQNSVLYDRFERWWIENKFQMREKPGHIKFSRRLKALGYKQQSIIKNKVTQRYWVGIKLNRASSVVVTPNVAAWQVTPPAPITT